MALAVYLDGRWVSSREEATIALFDHGFLYGDGVFEGIRVYNGRVFRLDDHIERFYESAKGISLEVPMSRDELVSIVLEGVRRSGLEEAYIRLVVSRGAGDLGIDPRKCKKPAIYIITDKIAVYPKEKYEKGLKLITASTRRLRPDMLNTQIKSLNYLNNILALQEAVRFGADEAIMLNEAGYVTEATADNIFVIKGGALVTPPAYLGLLKGVTRGVVLEIARILGMDASEQVMVLQDVYGGDEVFLTGTGAELVPVVEVDGRSIGGGRPGPQFLRLLAAFRERTRWDGTPVHPETEEKSPVDPPAKARPAKGARAGRLPATPVQ
jgi:branched-chain amino acid aminotransferase